jgi:hypothetical protein
MTAVSSARHIVIVHGIHSREGESSVWRLKPYLQLEGHTVEMFEYGYEGALWARWKNPALARRLAYEHPSGCDFVCHSNGAAVLWLAMRYRGLMAGRVSLVNPALDTGRRLPGAQSLDIYYNAHDSVAGLSSLLIGHPWGRMGNAGWMGPYDPAIANIDCARTHGMPELSGHLDFFTGAKLDAWGRYLATRHRRPPCI